MSCVCEDSAMEMLLVSATSLSLLVDVVLVGPETGDALESGSTAVTSVS